VRPETRIFDVELFDRHTFGESVELVEEGGTLSAEIVGGVLALRSEAEHTTGVLSARIRLPWDPGRPK
jgi:hypothetical protein